MNTSVVICTYNRAESLRRTLETCCALSCPDGLTWELLVVDNNSGDHTKQVCGEFVGRLPVRYLFEPHQGKSCALNLAVREAQGELLLFTDDDVDLDPDWLSALWSAAVEFPDASFLGGRSLPLWERPPPPWLAKHSKDLLACVSVHLDKGDGVRFLTQCDTSLFFGCNLAVRRRLLVGAFGFSEVIGPRGRDATRQEESLLQCQLLAAGHRGLYVGGAVVLHRNPPCRMTERYVREWYVGAGMSDVRLGQIDDSPYRLLGTPRYLWRILLGRCCSYATSRLFCDSSTWLPAEKAMARTWGWIREFRSQTTKPSTHSATSR